MELDFVSLVPAGDNPEARVVISKAETAETNHNKENQMPEINKTDLPAEVVQYIDNLEAAYEAAESENETLKADVTKGQARATELETMLSKSVPKDEESAEEITKSLLAKADPAVRALIEKQTADLKRLEAVSKAAEDARQEQIYIAKAAEVPNVGEDRKELAGILRRVAEHLSADDAAGLEKILKAANAQIETSDLFKSIGRQFESSVDAQIKATAVEILKSEPTLTAEQAQAKAWALNPKLAMQAMEEEGR